jgi:hypothetical protein
MEDFYWFHVDTTHAAYNGFVNGITVKFAQSRPDNNLSINNNVADTEALIKLVAEVGWIDTPAGNFAKNYPGMLRIFTPADHDEAFALVITEAWTGLPPGPSTPP